MAGVNIVVTCTKQKTREPLPRLQLRNVNAKNRATRVQKWSRILHSTNEEGLSAKDLYAGDHWAVAREMPELRTNKRPVNVWVASAGYGLVHIDQPIVPYAATFSAPHPDSVVNGDIEVTPREQKAAWWNELVLCDWQREKPFSICQLAEESPETPIIVAPSNNYLNALYDDVNNAGRKLAKPSLLSIVSAGTDSLRDLTDFLIPCNATLQHFVGGVRRSLNVRLVRHALTKLRQGKLTRDRLTRTFQAMIDDAPELVKYDRMPMSDRDVQKFIRAAIRKKPTATHTGLLRELRASGKACEQKRFRQLFGEVKETHDG